MESLVPAIIGILFCTSFGLGLLTLRMKALRKQEKDRFQALIDSVPCSISWVNSDDTYIAANRELANLLEIETNEFIGKKVGFMGGKREYIEFVKNFFKQPKEMDRFEFQVGETDGTRDILSIARKYNKNRESVIIGVDITEQKEAQRIIVDQQDALVASEKLSSLGEMSATIASDIHSPLSELEMHTNYAKEILEEDEKHQKVLTQLNNISETTARISKIVNSLLHFSRDTSQDSPEDTDARQIIEDTVSLCRHRFLKSSISIHIEVPEHPLPIFCKKVQIQQALLNLLNNSHDAVGNLSEKWVKITAEIQGTHIVLSVIDSGKGISEELRERILQPFFSTKEPGRGTGLGLSIVSRVAEAHTGQLVLNKDHLNTCFQLKIPARGEASTKAA